VIILDTNIISELARQVPEPGVISWLDSLPAEEVGTTAITAAELLYGVARMPAGRRRRNWRRRSAGCSATSSGTASCPSTSTAPRGTPI
jgi:predicted nucleic acid-binding protein